MVQLDRIIQPPQHTDSRRMHPTTQLNTPNSHTRGTPESRRCSWPNPLPRECSTVEVVFWSRLVVGSRGISSGILIEKYIATATSRLSGFLHSHRLDIPYPYMLASTADKHRGSLTPYPTHRGHANRSPCVPLRAV